MMSKENFAHYVDMAMQADGLGFLRPVVEKELLHYEIFSALDQEGLLRNLVFQGGTSLRLCHGSERFSEDLDFAGGEDFDARSMTNIRDCIAGKIGRRFGLDVTVREPKENSVESNVRVAKWTIAIQTSPERPDVPKQKIKLEIANVPAYSREILPLRINYSVLEGRSQPLVAVESKNEILADKLIALPASISRVKNSSLEFTPSRIRYRDIWDIAWLAGQDTQMEASMVRRKIADYGMVDFLQLLDRAISAIPAISRSDAFRAQMARFLPRHRHNQVLGNPGYEKYFENAVNGFFTSLRKDLEEDLRRDSVSINRARKRKKPGLEL